MSKIPPNQLFYYFKKLQKSFNKNHLHFYVKTYNKKTTNFEKIVFFPNLDIVIKKCLPTFSQKYQNKVLKTLSTRYFQHSKIKEQNRKQFAKKYQFLNKKQDKKVNMEVSELINILQKQSKETQFQIQQIGYENEDKECLFLTLTLPPKYHSKYTNTLGKQVNNTKFNNDLIKQGYDYLNDTQRQIYKNIKKIDKSIRFIKMIEPHKDFTPHIHIQYWIDKKDIKKVRTSILKTIDNKVKINEIGKQSKLIRLYKKEGKNVSGYITKYITKLIEDLSKNETKLYILDGWKRLNKMRLFSGSNPTINKSLYGTIVSIAADGLDKEEYPNMGVWSLKNIQLVKTLDTKTKIKHTPKNPKYIIHINKRKMFKIKKNDIEDITIYYQRIYQKVYDIEDNFKCIRNSQDWQIILKTTKIVHFDYLKTIQVYRHLNIVNNLDYENDKIQYEIFKHNYSIY